MSYPKVKCADIGQSNMVGIDGGIPFYKGGINTFNYKTSFWGQPCKNPYSTANYFIYVIDNNHNHGGNKWRI